jgi:hypothetical protein
MAQIGSKCAALSPSNNHKQLTTEPAAWLFCWHGGTTYAGTNRQPYRSSGTDKESVQKRHNGFQLLAAPSSQETGVIGALGRGICLNYGAHNRES